MQVQAVEESLHGVAAEGEAAAAATIALQQRLAARDGELAEAQAQLAARQERIQKMQSQLALAAEEKDASSKEIERHSHRCLSRSHLATVEIAFGLVASARNSMCQAAVEAAV